MINNVSLFTFKVSQVKGALLVEGKDRSLAFHERATSKDVIEELNRMIKKGDENTVDRQQESHVALDKLDVQCWRPTGWVHVERDIDFNDPKVNEIFINENANFSTFQTTQNFCTLNNIYLCIEILSIRVCIGRYYLRSIND